MDSAGEFPKDIVNCTNKNMEGGKRMERKMKRRWKELLVAVIFSLSLVFSSSAPAASVAYAMQTQTQKAEKTKLTVIHPNIALNVGEITEVKVFVTPENQKLTYRSTDNTCVKVSKTGLVTAVKPGTASIIVKAKDGTKTEIKVTVYKKNAKSLIQDDFYDAVNAKTIKKMDLGDEADVSRFSEVQDLVDEQMKGIVNDLLSGKDTYEAGSIERKICDFYAAGVDMTARDALGAKPLKPYLDKIDAAKTIDEYLDALILISKETGCQSILSAGVGVDDMDSSRYIYNFGVGGVSVSKVFFNPLYANTLQIYQNLFAELYNLNENSDKGQEIAAKYIEFLRPIAEHSLNQEDYYDASKTYNIKSREEIKQIFSNIDIDRYLNETGFQDLKEACVADLGCAEYVNTLLVPENLEMLKIYTRMSFYLATVMSLTTDHYKLVENTNNALTGSSKVETMEEVMQENIQQIYAWEFSKLYTDKYFPESSKKAVEKMTKKIIRTYRKRIEKLDWMNEKTKKKAIEKLDNMKVKIGYPDTYPEGMTSFEVTAGESYFDLCVKLNLLQKESNLAVINEKVDKEEWAMLPTVVNACYNPSANDITFPAAILQGEFYDPERTEEENYGGIGVVIAHEITHAFDTSGATYDKDGNYKNWWTKKDKKEFEKRAEKLKTYYNGFEIGVIEKNGEDVVLFQNGDLTITENIADTGAVACMLEIIGNDKAKLKRFFKSYANTWASKATDQYADYLLAMDVHSADKVRVNAAIALFDEFYEVFDIDKDDAMYVAPKNRVQIW